VIGTLIESGYDLERVLDFSFEQISFIARCIVRHKAKMLNMVFEPIAAGFGKKGKKQRRAESIETQKKLRQSGASPEVRDQMLVDKLAGLGISVKDQ
tara:strand:+ start:982 stop:1272 length:291 start_codon:yes stop_codon:yes gene_type:complete